MGNLQIASISFGSLMPVLQACVSAVPTVLGLLGGIWAATIRRTAQSRFETGVSRETESQLNKKLAQIALKEQELRQLNDAEDELIRRINDRSEAYAKHLEARIETQGQEIEELSNRIKILEIENRNTIRENLAHAKYITILVRTIISLGAEVPPRTREFDV